MKIRKTCRHKNNQQQKQVTRKGFWIWRCHLQFGKPQDHGTTLTASGEKDSDPRILAKISLRVRVEDRLFRSARVPPCTISQETIQEGSLDK